MAQTTVGVLGLGALGVALLKRLGDAGFEVAATDPNPRAFQAYMAAGGSSPAGSPLQLARTSDIVVLALTADALESSLRGSSGIAAAMRPGTIVVDMSESESEAGLALSRSLESGGVAWVEAIVLGAPQTVSGGEATLLTGGEASQLDKCKSLFAAISSRIIVTGRVGSATFVKSLANAVSALNVSIFCEALIISRAAGVAPNFALEAFEANDAVSAPAFLREQIFSRNLDAGYSLETVTRDVDRSLKASAMLNIPAPYLSTIRQSLSAAHHQQDGTGDFTDLVRFMETVTRLELSEGQVS